MDLDRLFVSDYVEFIQAERCCICCMPIPYCLCDMIHSTAD